MDAMQVKLEVQEAFGACFAITGLQPYTVATRISQDALAAGLLPDITKVSGSTTHAIIDGGEWRASLKYTAPATQESKILDHLLWFKDWSMIPKVYVANGNWIVTEYIKSDWRYSDAPVKFVTGLFDILRDFERFTKPVDLPLVDMSRYLSGKFLDEVIVWLGTDALVFAEYLGALEKVKSLANNGYGDMPLTLSHGDFQPGNIIYDHTDKCWVVDWADCRMRPRGFDIAWLLQGLVGVYKLSEEEAKGLWNEYNQDGDEATRNHLLNRVVSAVKYARNATGRPEQITAFGNNLKSLAYLLGELDA